MGVVDQQLILNYVIFCCLQEYEAFKNILELEDRMETDSMIEESFSDEDEEENIFPEENISSDRNRGV